MPTDIAVYSGALSWYSTQLRDWYNNLHNDYMTTSDVMQVIAILIYITNDIEMQLNHSKQLTHANISSRLRTVFLTLNVSYVVLDYTHVDRFHIVERTSRRREQ